MIGITERGDAGLDTSWTAWVCDERKPAILITKAPSRLVNMNLSDYNVIVHCTITGYGGTFMEPNVPSAEHEIQAYKHICKHLNVNRVVLRIDPIIPTKKGIKKALDVYQHRIEGGRVRISFLDGYTHTRNRIIDATGYDLPWSGVHFPLKERMALYEEHFSDCEICGEPGMPCIGCVSAKDCSILGVKPTTTLAGQRGACHCLSLKKELLFHKGQCKHGCLYCYWK